VDLMEGVISKFVERRKGPKNKRTKKSKKTMEVIMKIRDQRIGAI
jgi:hypothetical protein